MFLHGWVHKDRANENSTTFLSEQILTPYFNTFTPYNMIRNNLPKVLAKNETLPSNISSENC